MFSLFEFAIGVRLLVFYSLCSLCLWGECLVCASGAPQKNSFGSLLL